MSLILLTCCFHLPGPSATVPAILAIAGDVLGELLDKQQGHEVTDKEIYRSAKAVNSRMYKARVCSQCCARQ